MPLEFGWTENQMKRAHDFGSLSSQYVISLFSEPYEKPLFDAYHAKVLMSGLVPSLAHSG